MDYTYFWQNMHFPLDSIQSVLLKPAIAVSRISNMQTITLGFSTVFATIYIYMSAILHRPGDPETMDVSDWTTLLTGKEATNLEKYREKLLVRKDRVRVFHVFPFETYLWGGAEVLILCVCVCVLTPSSILKFFFANCFTIHIYIYIDTVHVWSFKDYCLNFNELQRGMK